MKNLIVPIDFSQHSLKGLEMALLFSRKMHVNIQMVYVQMKSSEIYAGPQLEEKKLAEKKFELIIKEYSKFLGNESRLRYIVKKGKVYEEIVNQAHSYKESMIITSTHGASGFEELFIGSNALKIISATDRPVITIRRDLASSEIKKIVLPIDNIPETRQKVVLASKIAMAFGSEVYVLTLSASKSQHVSQKLEAYTRQVIKFLESAKIKYQRSTAFGDNPADMTLEYATKVKADLIAIMTEKVSALTNLFFGSYAHQLINQSNIPVLNIKPQEIHLPRDFSTFGEA